MVSQRATKPPRSDLTGYQTADFNGIKPIEQIAARRPPQSAGQPRLDVYSPAPYSPTPTGCIHSGSLLNQREDRPGEMISSNEITTSGNLNLFANCFWPGRTRVIYVDPKEDPPPPQPRKIGE